MFFFFLESRRAKDAETIFVRQRTRESTNLALWIFFEQPPEGVVEELVLRVSVQHTREIVDKELT